MGNFLQGNNGEKKLFLSCSCWVFFSCLVFASFIFASVVCFIVVVFVLLLFLLCFFVCLFFCMDDQGGCLGESFFDVSLFTSYLVCFMELEGWDHIL